MEERKRLRKNIYMPIRICLYLHIVRMCVIHIRNTEHVDIWQYSWIQELGYIADLLRSSTITKCCFMKITSTTMRTANTASIRRESGNNKKKGKVWYITSFRDAIWPSRHDDLAENPNRRSTSVAPTNRWKLETYPRQSSSDDVHKAATRFPMKSSPPPLPSCYPSPRRRAIYRPYLWHSGTLTIPAIPLYAVVNGAKWDTSARSIRSIYSTCVIRSDRLHMKHNKKT